MSYIPLGDTQEVVERSIFHSIRRQLVEKKRLPDMKNYPNTQAGITQFKADLAQLKVDCGWVVEVFGHSSNEDKYIKKIPRMVMVPSLAIPGVIGGSPGKIYTRNNPNVLAEGFTSSVQPAQTLDYMYDIHMVYETAEQAREMNQLLAIACPRKGYIPLVDASGDPVPDKLFFVQFLNFRQIDDVKQGYMEVVYNYQVTDLFEIENTIIDTKVMPISEITICQIEEDTDPENLFRDFKEPK